MKWNEFFRPTDQKIKTAIIIIVFYYVIGYLSGFTINLVASKSIQDIGNALVQEVINQSNVTILTFVITFVLASILNFTILLLAAYLTACIIAMIFKKK